MTKHTHKVSSKYTKTLGPKIRIASNSLEELGSLYMCLKQPCEAVSGV